MAKLYLVMWIGILLVSIVNASSIYTDQINFEPNSSRTHSQRVQFDSNVNIDVVLDSRFNLTWSSPVATTAGNNISWTNESYVEFNVTSPSNCTEGQVYRMPVYQDGNIFSSFTFICVPDDKIVDYKGEFGHGDGNYLNYQDYPYLPANSDISLFNLIRVYTFGSYFNPNEDGLNASISCIFPNYLVLTRQKNQGTEITHNEDSIDATFYWTNLLGNWFRLAPLEQEINGLAVGENYNITCSELTYYYSTGRMRADFDPISFEARSTMPLSVNATIDASYDGIIYKISNDEEYPIYDVEFLWTTDTGDSYVESIVELEPNETVGFEVFLEGSGSLTLDASFVPVWQKTSLKPIRYSQTYTTPFAFSGADSSIARVIEVVSTATSQKRVTITKFPELLSENVYKVRVIHEVNGIPTDADSLPVIAINDPDYYVEDSGIMSKIGTGVYEYLYLINSSQPSGVWMTEVNVTSSGSIIPRFDYWELEANPAEVTVDVLDECLPTPAFKMTIVNEGTSPQEYQYRCWITPRALGQYDDLDTVDSLGGAKLIIPTERWTREFVFDLFDDGSHYFRCEVFWGSEVSRASQQFTALTADECRAVAGGIFGSLPPVQKFTLLGTVTGLSMFFGFMFYRRRRKQEAGTYA